MTTSIQTVLQKIAILLTGHGANATQLQELEGFSGADGKYVALIQGINHFLETQTKASSAATIVSQLAKNGLGLSLGATDATGIANYITDNKLSWSDVVVTCLQMGGSAGVTLDNRAAAVNTFLDQLRTSDKTDLFAGTSVLQTVKNLVGNIDANTVSLNNAQAGFSTLSSILSSNGIRGSVVDGYVKGATVFVDANSDGKLNDGEFSTTTDASGHYNLPLNAGIGKLIASGGTDILTGKPFKGVMTALPGSTTINPISTLIEAVGSKAQSLAELANTTFTVGKALGLPNNVNLLTYDPLAVLADSHASAADKATALAVQKTALQIQNIITQVGNTLDASSANVTAVSAAEAITDTLASIISQSSTTLDLTNPTLLGGVIQSSATQLGLSTSATQTGQIAAVTSASNTAAQTASDITKLGQVADVAQGSATDALIAAAGGNGSFSSVASNFTGSSLETAINNADVGDIAAGVPAPTPVTTPTTPTDTSSSTSSSIPSTPAPQSDLVTPTMIAATVSANGTTLSITYSEPLTGTPEAGDYALTGNTITNATLSGSTVTLTLGTPVITGTTVSNLVYTATAGAANSIKDAATPTANAAATQTLATVTNNSTVAPPPPPDTTAPTMSSAAVSTDGTQIIITYSEALTGTPEIGDYAATGVDLTGATAAITGTTNNQVTLTLAAALNSAATVSNLVYTASAGTANSIKDAATPTANAAADQTLPTITNNSTVPVPDTTPPTMSSAVIAADGTTLTITYSEALSGTPEAGDYALTGNTITNATLSGNTVTLTLGTAVVTGATVSNLVYTASAGAANSIKDAATPTANAAATQTLATITNNSTVSVPDTTAPTMNSAAISADGTTLVITYSEALSGTPEADDYALTGNTITNATLSGSTVTLTLGTPVITGATVSNLVYTATAGAANSIKDAATPTANAAATQTLATVTNNSTVAPPPPPDTTAPTISSAAVSTDGTQIIITYSEALTGTPEIGDYAATGVDLTGATAAVTGTTNNQVTLTLATALNSAATVSNLVYTATAGTADSIKDAATPTPNAAATQTLATITNNSTVTPPSSTAPTLVTSNQTFRLEPTSPEVRLEFNEAVHAGTGNLVLVDDSTINPVNINIDVTDTSKIYFATVQSPQGTTIGQSKLNPYNLGLVVGHNYHLTIPSGAILDSSNESFAGLTDPAGIVFNVVADATPPSMQSAAVSTDGTQIVITYSEPLAGIPEAGDYTATGVDLTGATAAITGATNNQVTLTLANALNSAATVSNLVYTASAGAPNSIKDTAPIANAALTNTLGAITNGTTTIAPPLLLSQNQTLKFEPVQSPLFKLEFNERIHAGVGNLVLVDDSGGTNITVDVTDTSKVTFEASLSIPDHGKLALTTTNLGFVVGHNYHLEIPAGAILDSSNESFAGLTDPTKMVLNVVADAIAPSMQSGVVSADGMKIILTYSEPLTGTAEAVDFTVRDNTVTAAEIGAGADTNKIILTLGTPITSATQTSVGLLDAYVRYANTGVLDSIKDAAILPNVMDSGYLPSITNNSTVVPVTGSAPVLLTPNQTFRVDPTTFMTEIIFNEPVHAGTGNIVLVDDTSGTRTNISVTDTSKIEIKTNPYNTSQGKSKLHTNALGLVANHNYHLEIPAGAILDSSNESFAGLTDPTGIVLNVVADATPPYMQSASVAADGSTLTITYYEALTGTAEAVDFTVGGNTVMNAVIGTGADNNKVILTLGTPVTSANLTGVTYTAANGTPNSIQDMATPANVAPDFTLQASQITYDGILTVLNTGSAAGYPHNIDPTLGKVITFSAPVHAGTGDIILRNDSGGADFIISVTDPKIGFRSSTMNGIQQGQLVFNQYNENLGLTVGNNYHLEIPASAVVPDGSGLSFSGLTDPTAIVWNVIADATPPWMQSASVAADGTTLTITYNEALTGTAEAGDYSVAGNTVTNAVIGTGADNNKVILTLGSTAAPAFTVDYSSTNGTPNSIKDTATPANAAGYTSGGMLDVKGNSAVQAIYKYLGGYQSVPTFSSTDILAFRDGNGAITNYLNLTGTSTKVFNSGTAAGITPTATDNIWVITDSHPEWNSAAAIDAAMASATVAGMDNGLVLVFNNGTENQMWYVGSAHTDNGSSTTDHSDVVHLATITLTGTTTLADLTAANFFVY